MLCSAAAWAGETAVISVEVTTAKLVAATPPKTGQLTTTISPQAERAALSARQPMGRLVTAEEVAAAIAYLASPLAGATTGTALAVDGGMQGLRTRPRTS